MTDADLSLRYLSEMPGKPCRKEAFTTQLPYLLKRQILTFKKVSSKKSAGRRQRQGDLCEFKTSLLYTASSRKARTVTQRTLS